MPTSEREAGTGRRRSGSANAAPRLFDEPAEGGSITALTPLRRDAATWAISVDGRVVARLGIDDVEALALAVGQTWSGDRAHAVRAALRRAAARRDAMSFLGRRDRSTAELAERLAARGHDDETARAVVAALVEQRVLDDAALARRIAAEALARKPLAAPAIAQRLRSRGLDEKLARTVAAETAGGSDPTEALVELARRRLRGMPGVSSAAACRRVAAALGRLGHDHDTVALVIDRLNLAGSPDPGGHDAA